MRKGRKKANKEITAPKRTLLIILSIIILLIVSLTIYIYCMLNGLKHTDLYTSKDTHDNIPVPASETTASITNTTTPSQVVPQKIKGITNIALFGVDRREGEDGPSRTDTIMILTIDGNSEKLKITSLMRDMYVYIPGKWSDRINAAYAYGGPSLAVDTINSNFGLDIKYYVTVDFKGIEKIIDKLGGIDIDVSEGEVPYINENSHSKVEGFGFKHLNGEQALAYMRIRYFGNGDFERTQRQRNASAQLFKSIKEIGILKSSELLSSVLPYIETNMEKTEIISFSSSILAFKNDIGQYRLPADDTFTDQYIREMAVLVPDIEDNKELLHEFIYGKKGLTADVSESTP